MVEGRIDSLRASAKNIGILGGTLLFCGAIAYVMGFASISTPSSANQYAAAGNVFFILGGIALAIAAILAIAAAVQEDKLNSR